MISICIAYYNRKETFLRTLASLDRSIDFELCIVDDGSREDQRIDSLVEAHQNPRNLLTDVPFDPLKIKYKRINPEEKTWVNPCIAYNMAANMAEGDKIILQNPECKHMGSILQHVENNLKPYHYMAFSCLSWDQTPFSLDEVKEINYAAAGQCQKGWYHHPGYNNRPYHFCCALHKTNFDKLKGFDERFKDGPCYDDVDLVDRVKKLGLQIVSPVEPYVIHQWHDSSHIFQTDSHQRFLNNQQIYHDIISGRLPSWS